MKVQCDACQSAEASVFCCADEAALCMKCDSKVHDANKLASKHRRLSLLEPSSSSSSDSLRCDICQERRAFFFCQADRAVLCRDCDLSIHSANELTAKHNRFLVPGARVSLKPIETLAAPEKAVATASAPKALMPPAQKVQDHAQPSMDLAVETVTASTSNSQFSQYLSEVEQFLTSASPERLDWGGSSETHAIGKYMDSDWAPNLGLLPEGFYGDSLAEVPHLPSATTDSGFCMYSQFGITMKPKAKQQVQNVPYFLPGFETGDDNFTVPDIVFAPPTKRMRPMSNPTLHDQQFFIL